MRDEIEVARNLGELLWRVQQAVDKGTVHLWHDYRTFAFALQLDLMPAEYSGLYAFREYIFESGLRHASVLPITAARIATKWNKALQHKETGE